MKLLFIFTLLFLTSCSHVPQQKVMNETPKFVHIKSTPENIPWWSRVDYFPSSEKIAGIPVQRFHNDWCAANEFTLADYEKSLSNNDLQTLKNNANIHFQFSGKFDNQHVLTAIAGVYKKCTGEKGNFIALIQSITKPDAQIISVLELNQNDARFMGLLPVTDNSLGVAWCLECDDLDVFEWDTTLRNLRLQRQNF